MDPSNCNCVGNVSTWTPKQECKAPTLIDGSLATMSVTWLTVAMLCTDEYSFATQTQTHVIRILAQRSSFCDKVLNILFVDTHTSMTLYHHTSL